MLNFVASFIARIWYMTLMSQIQNTIQYTNTIQIPALMRFNFFFPYLLHISFWKIRRPRRKPRRILFFFFFLLCLNVFCDSLDVECEEGHVIVSAGDLGDTISGINNIYSVILIEQRILKHLKLSLKIYIYIIQCKTYCGKLHVVLIIA